VHAEDVSTGKERASVPDGTPGDDDQLAVLDQSVDFEEEIPAPPVHVAVADAADAATVVKAILPSKPATRTTVIKDRSSQRGGLMGFNSVEVLLRLSWLFIRSPSTSCASITGRYPCCTVALCFHTVLRGVIVLLPKSSVQEFFINICSSFKLSSFAHHFVTDCGWLMR
jgi:urea transporter